MKELDARRWLRRSKWLSKHDSLAPRQDGKRLHKYILYFNAAAKQTPLTVTAIPPTKEFEFKQCYGGRSSLRRERLEDTKLYDSYLPGTIKPLNNQRLILLF